MGFTRETTWLFVAVMLLVAIANRVSAFLYQNKSESLAAVYLMFTAGALVVAAAGGLRMLEFSTWSDQAPWLLVIPIGYIVASKLWTGKTPERPVAIAAHAAMVVILGHVFFEALSIAVKGALPVPHLQLALIFGQASVFYALAAIFRKQIVSCYVSVAAGCAAIWQLMLLVDLPLEVFTIGFAVVGLVMIIVSRWIGWDEQQVYSAEGDEKTIAQGAGVVVNQSGHAIVSVTMLVALLKGLAQLAAVGMDKRDLTTIEWAALGIMTAVSLIAAVVSRSENWRRLYTIAAIAMAGVSVLTINMAIDIPLWRKAEVFTVAAGLFILGSSYIGRFREQGPAGENETVSLGLWAGSLMASLPLLGVVFYQWKSVDAFAVYDELALIVITLLLVATGVMWRVKASTLFGGGTLFIYLCVLVVSLVYQPHVAIGIYLTAGGGLLFGLGILLALYRDHLLALPEQMANREGVFEMFDWR